MGRRKQKSRGQGDVELNLAAMLDMAFQLLTFFILTFKPVPAEGDIRLRLPLPQAASVRPTEPEKPGDDPNNKNPAAELTLVINAFPDSQGGIQSLAIGERPVSLSQLSAELKGILAAKGTPFEQVVIQAGSGLRYENLMYIIDVCTHQKFADGKPLTKLSFVELPSG